ncbi:MAG: purine-nucleoside phosphorylase, partial [Ruminococcus sp.]|nr:purine-nucleoside phosphorylase [Ruminococcus sp.]
PMSTVEGHKGRFVFGYVNTGERKVPVVIMQGRVHYYEGYSMKEVVMPIRLMKMMGAKALMLTNAAGGVNWGYECGDLMLIRDHINLAPSPLIGENVSELGVRFPDMSEIYSKRLRDAVKTAARRLGIGLREGVYIQLTGPQYESPSEVRMVRTLGADAVGMSTAAEAVAARHCGLEVAGISCISNLACGVSSRPLSHEEVQETADRVAPLFRKLITESLGEIYGVIGG